MRPTLYVSAARYLQQLQKHLLPDACLSDMNSYVICKEPFMSCFQPHIIGRTIESRMQVSKISSSVRQMCGIWSVNILFATAVLAAACTIDRNSLPWHANGCSIFFCLFIFFFRPLPAWISPLFVFLMSLRPWSAPRQSQVSAC